MDWGVVGTLLQLAGVATTAVGFWQTWREFGEPGEGFFDPVTNWAGGAWRRFASSVAARVRRLLRRPQPVVVTPGTEHLHIETFPADARIGYGDLPADAEAAFVELQRRTQDLMKRVTDNLDGYTKGLRDVRGEVADLSRRLDAARAGLEERTRRVAIGGIRLEAAGLVLVAVGTVLQTLSA